MTKMRLAVCIIATFIALSGASPVEVEASLAAGKCDTLVLKMMDCLSFLTSVANKQAKPQGDCCSGFKAVLNTNPDCVCEAMKSSANLGIMIDMKKAEELPAACGIKAPPSFGNCEVTAAPANPPATTANPPSVSTPSPSSSIPVLTPTEPPMPMVQPNPTLPNPPAPSASVMGGTPNLAPAPSPLAAKKSGAHATSVNVALFLSIFALFHFIGIY